MQAVLAKEQTCHFFAVETRSDIPEQFWVDTKALIGFSQSQIQLQLLRYGVKCFYHWPTTSPNTPLFNTTTITPVSTAVSRWVL